MKSNLVIFTCLLLYSQSPRANDDVLKKLMDMGVEKSLDIETQNINYTKSKNNTWQSYANLLPTISASTSRSYTKTRDYVDGGDGSIATKNARSDDLTINANWVIWDNFGKLNTLRTTRLAETIALHTNEAGRQNYYDQIIEQYFNIQELIYRQNSTKELFNQATQAKDEAQYLIKLGQKTKFEAFDAEIDMVNAERDLMEIKNSLDVANRNLKSLIGSDDNIDIPPIDLLTYKPYYLENFEKVFEKNKTNWKDNYETKNKSILISKLNFESAAISYFGEKLNLLPQLSIGLSDTFDYGYKVKQDAPSYENTPKNTVAISFNATWTLWDFWSTPKKVENSLLDFKIAEIQFKQSKINIQTDIQNLIDQYEINLKSVEASLLVLDKAIKNYEYNSYMYKLGKINLIVRQKAMDQLHSAKTELASRLKSKYTLASKLMIAFGEKIYNPTIDTTNGSLFK